MEHAGDQVLIADRDLLEHAGGWRGPLIVIGDTGGLPPDTLSYDRLVEDAPQREAPEDPDEGAAAAMCYTSGTTGRPKGVLYSHRAIVLHSLASALPDAFNLGENDTILAAVPMFHANAWGLPYTAALVGAQQVFARNAFDAAHLLSLIVGERVTFAAGVPTIWLQVLQELDRAPGGYDLSALRSIVVGGGACPPEMIRGYEERHGIGIITSWGMTEMTPVGTIGRNTPTLGEAAQAYSQRANPGRPLPLVELRLRQNDRDLPWDGVSMGELEVRGPWVARTYYASADDTGFTSDGWFRTGDIASIDRHGGLTIRDRAKDLIKSGGEWISSVALENALLGHPAVAEAAVIAIPNPTWQERPLALVVLRPMAAATEADLRAHLAREFPDWYLPDAFVFVETIPRTGTGKAQKQLLREQFRNQR
jgi:fatty-acyl-CoA synthase